LYGSYARGDWVDDPIGGYRSDYDILIVVNDERLTDTVEYWSVAEDRLMRDYRITMTLSAEVGIIIHTLGDVNRQLERGRPFFIDVSQQGIALYESEGYPFSKPSYLPSREAKAEAQTNFDRWFPTAERSIRTFELQRSEGDDAFWRRKAAFELHQAVEQLYHCTMLVLNLYSPKSHKLNFLRSHAEELASSLIEAWPRDDKFSRRSFELLRQAYVNARYSTNYEISGEQLAWLGKRVIILRSLVKSVCDRRLNG